MSQCRLGLQQQHSAAAAVAAAAARVQWPATRLAGAANAVWATERLMVASLRLRLPRKGRSSAPTLPCRRLRPGRELAHGPDDLRHSAAWNEPDCVGHGWRRQRRAR